MITFIVNNWKEFIGFTGIVIALWKYFDTRKRELAWKKTETLFQLGNQFDSDPDISQAILLIEDRLPKVHINQLFDENGNPNNDSHGKLLNQLDKCLNFLERLSYSHIKMKTLSLDEVSHFGAYYQYILEIERLKSYCESYGFENVVELAEKYNNAN